MKLTCISNEFYGHGSILRRFLDKSFAPIRGRIQHGWTPSSLEVDRLITAGEPVFVWTDRDARLLIKKCPRANVLTIGSPWLYKESNTQEKRNGLIAFPHHSLFDKIIRSGWEEYTAWLEKFSKAEGFSKTTVCLHARDFERQEVRDCFRNIEVTSCGDPMNPEFLDVFDSLVSAYEAMTTNSVSTALWYCLASSLAVRVDGPFTKAEPADRYEELVGNADWIQVNYPAVAKQWCKNVDIAWLELGISSFKTKDKLVNLLEFLPFEDK